MPLIRKPEELNISLKKTIAPSIPYTYKPGFYEFCKDNNLEETMLNMIIWIMMVCAIRMRDHNDFTPEVLQYSHVFYPAHDDHFIDSKSSKNKVNLKPEWECYELTNERDENSVVKTVCRAFNPSAAYRVSLPNTNDCGFYWLEPLMVAEMKGDMNDQNVINFFAGHSINIPSGLNILKVVKWASSVVDYQISDELLTSFSNQSDWVKYRVSASSTPALCQRMIDDLGTRADRMLPTDQIEAVKLAVASPWEKVKSDRISDKTKMITHAFLSAYKVLPEKWYQGRRSVDVTPPSTYKLYEGFFKSLASSIEDVGKESDDDVLISSGIYIK